MWGCVAIPHGGFRRGGVGGTPRGVTGSIWGGSK